MSGNKERIDTLELQVQILTKVIKALGEATGFDELIMDHTGQVIGIRTRNGKHAR